MAEALDPAIPGDIDASAKQVLKLASDRHLMLATAESCTGGLLASLLTDMPGLSHAFERGFVVYTNDAKHELLGVPAAPLEFPGPVSEVVARAMAEGAVAHSHADIAAAVTGFTEAGSDGEAGLVHFAVARRERDTAHRCMHFGDIGRAQVRLACLRTALEMLDTALGA
jgi:nicotinamide-nucleotide amidase